MLLRSARTTFCTLAISVGTAAGAAPMATDGQDSDPALSTGQTGDAAMTISSGSTSIDRLMKLQEGESSPVPSQEKSPPRKTMVEGALPAKIAATQTAASAASPLATLQAAILGDSSTAAKSQGSPRAPDSYGVRESERQSMGSALRVPEMQAQSNPQDRPTTGVAFTIARFVRENRVLVIGASLAVLAMVWGAATFASQQRRR